MREEGLAAKRDEESRRVFYFVMTDRNKYELWVCTCELQHEGFSWGDLKEVHTPFILTFEELVQ